MPVGTPRAYLTDFRGLKYQVVFSYCLRTAAQFKSWAGLGVNAPQGTRFRGQKTPTATEIHGFGRFPHRVRIPEPNQPPPRRERWPRNIHGGHAGSLQCLRNRQGQPAWARMAGIACLGSGPGCGWAWAWACIAPCGWRWQGLVVGCDLCCCIFLINGSAIGRAIRRAVFCMQWHIYTIRTIPGTLTHLPRLLTFAAAISTGLLYSHAAEVLP